MKEFKFMLLSLFCLLFNFQAAAQNELRVDEQTLRKHAVSQVSPIYPPIAKAAQVQGTVVFELRIGINGKIESMKVVSGPPMLQQAAIDSLKQLEFKPFNKEGTPTVANGPFSISFNLGKDKPTTDEEELAERYFPASDECRKEISAHSDSEKAAEVCKQAAAYAEQFPPDRRFIEKRSAFVWAGWALAYNGDFKGALAWAEKAVEVVKLGHDDNSGTTQLIQSELLRMESREISQPLIEISMWQRNLDEKGFNGQSKESSNISTATSAR